MAGSYNYDDVSIFAPEGRVMALDYVKAAIEQGNTSVGLCNKKQGVIVAHTGTPTKISYPYKKIYDINESCCFTFSGVTNDGLLLVEYLQNESLWLDVYLGKKKTIEMFYDISVDASLRTMRNNNRMYGVGGIMLCEGRKGIEMVEFEPTGITQYVFGACVGLRSQVAITVLKENVNEFEDMSRNEMIKIGVDAIKKANSTETISQENVEIVVLEQGGKLERVEVGFFLE